MNILITGCAGFIGSHVSRFLVEAGYMVTGIDDLSTGKIQNIENIISESNFDFVKNTILEWSLNKSYQKYDIVIHLAANNSVTKSMADPWPYFFNNGNGLLGFLEFCRPDCKIIFASSSSVYGDIPDILKVEHRLGVPLSPYATSKMINETQAYWYYKTKGRKSIGLRFFNVFGPRQNPYGDYAAVIPKWFQQEEIEIYGDGAQMRDFTYISNIVFAIDRSIKTDIWGCFNIGTGVSTSLLNLAALMGKTKIKFLPARLGDVKNSMADISMAKEHLKYYPERSLEDGLNEYKEWMLRNLI